MWQLGHNNWIKYGWGNELNSIKDSETTKFHIDFSGHDNIEKLYLPFAAAVDAVHKIAETYPSPYTLMCTGGVDSQSMILAWIESKVPFEIVSFRYISENIFFNDYDLVELDKLAEFHGLTVNYKEFDIISFLENDLVEIAKSTDCTSPHFCTHMKFTDSVTNGTILFSGNALHKNGAQITYDMLALHRYAIKIENTNKKIIPFFFLHTPELAYSFINNNLNIKDYIKGGFTVISPPQKYTGFEKIKDYYDKYTRRVTSKQKLLYARLPSARVFDYLFRYSFYASGKEMKKPTFILKNIL